MTTPSTSHRRRRRRPARLALSATPAPVHAEMQAAPARPRTAGECCRTWSSEHLTPGGVVVRTIWHEPACQTWSRK
ncbi:hypothetical protein ACIRVF_42195 [Kitasatospora sp. NPDC101157]|uniref:hypothetical protein n=1 Tax=Kitasatospora sp. NPDC101157 TaxID=3364098 RepID=UPI00380A8F8D